MDRDAALADRDRARAQVDRLGDQVTNLTAALVRMPDQAPTPQQP